MSPSRKCAGSCPFSRALLITSVSIGARGPARYLYTSFGIRFGPAAFIVGSWIMTCLTSLVVTSALIIS